MKMVREPDRVDVRYDEPRLTHPVGDRCLVCGRSLPDHSIDELDYCECTYEAYR